MTGHLKYNFTYIQHDVNGIAKLNIYWPEQTIGTQLNITIVEEPSADVDWETEISGKAASIVCILFIYYSAVRIDSVHTIKLRSNHL